MHSHTIAIETPHGCFQAHFSEQGLCGLEFPSKKQTAGKAVDLRTLPAAIRGWAQTTKRAIAAVLAGQSPAALPPLDLSVGTEFQQRVWGALSKIPCGETRTYGQVARAIGRPKAVRAVGGACGANPIPVLVPCHRVKAAGGGLGGFSGGLAWKRLLLECEQGGKPARAS